MICVSARQLCVAWICWLSSRLSNLGHVLPQGWSRHCPILIPHPGLPATPGKNVRTQRARGLDFKGAAREFPPTPTPLLHYSLGD